MEQYENKGVKKGLVILLCVIVAAASCLVTLAGTQLYRTYNGGAYTVSKEYYDFLVRYKRLFEVESLLNAEHLYDAEEEDLVDYAIKGLTAAFGDVYTTYLTPEEYAQMQQDYDGEMAGVGIVIGTDPADLMATVVRVYPNTPAAAAGVQKGDKIIAVDGESVLDSDISDIATLLRGELGTQVTMTVLRGGQQVSIQMTRDTFTIDRVSARMLEHNIGYIQITEFTGNAHDRFLEEIDNLTDQGMKALIIDLRDNPGGYLNDACDMIDVLVPEGKIVYMEDHAGEQEVITSDADHLDIPIVVLVNGNSASASEIMAGALQDHNCATIIGTTTYGKGLVQITLPFKSDNAAVKYTFAQYFTPNGRNINGIGIEPDIYIELDGELLENSFLITDETDTQLQKGIEVLCSALGIEEETPQPTETTTQE